MKVVLNSDCLRERQYAQKYLKEQFGFPEYYGYNLDALYDCLTDLGETEIVISGENDSRYLRRVRRVLEAAERDNPALTVISEKEGVILE